MSARTLKVDLIMPFEQILRIPTGKIEIPELEFFLGTTRVHSVSRTHHKHSKCLHTHTRAHAVWLVGT